MFPTHVLEDGGKIPSVSKDEIIPVQLCIDLNMTFNKYSVSLEPSLCIDESSRLACRALYLLQGNRLLDYLE